MLKVGNYRNTGRLLAALAAVGLSAGAGAGAAHAASGQSASGDFVSGAFHGKFSAVRAAGAPATSATGTFTAVTTVAGGTVMTVSGPVKCLSVVGDRLGLFYPVTSSTPQAVSQLNGGVFVYVQQASAGQPAKVSFVPVPLSAAASCDPQPALLPIQSGTVTLSASSTGSGGSSGSQSGATSKSGTAPSYRRKHLHHQRRPARHHKRQHSVPRRHGPPPEAPGDSG